MAYAVCVTATEGKTIVFSNVASISLQNDFRSLFSKYNKDEKVSVLSGHVSVTPNGPWQRVEMDESLSVLEALNLRHVLFKVATLEEAETKEGPPKQNAQQQQID
jgi:hypothetical protein